MSSDSKDTGSQQFQNFGISSPHKKSDSQESQTFGKPSFNKFRGGHKSHNPVTFTCRLNVMDKKRKRRRDTTALAQITHPSLQP